MERHPFSIENILKDTRGAGSILKIAPTSEALALAERMAGKLCLYCTGLDRKFQETLTVSANTLLEVSQNELVHKIWNFRKFGTVQYVQSTLRKKIMNVSYLSFLYKARIVLYIDYRNCESLVSHFEYWGRKSWIAGRRFGIQAGKFVS